MTRTTFNTVLTAGMIAAAAGSPALASDSFSENISFDYDANQGITNPVLQGFDSMGGTRQLDRVTMDFNHNFDATLFIESTGPTDLEAGDFIVNTSYISLFQFGLADDGDGDDDDDGPGTPFFGPGAFFVDNVQPGLTAYDNTPGNDGTDSFSQNYMDSYSNSWEFNTMDSQFVLDALTDTGPLTTVFGGFLEIQFQWINDPSWPPPGGFFPDYPNDAAVWVSFDELRHFGDFTVTYEYSPVPAPAGALALSGLALFVGRRRSN